VLFLYVKVTDVRMLAPREMACVKGSDECVGVLTEQQPTRIQSRPWGCLRGCAATKGTHINWLGLSSEGEVFVVNQLDSTCKRQQGLHCTLLEDIEGEMGGI